MSTNTRRKSDSEITVMRRVEHLLSELDERSRLRVMTWIADRFAPLPISVESLGPFPGDRDELHRLSPTAWIPKEPG